MQNNLEAFRATVEIMKSMTSTVNHCPNEDYGNAVSDALQVIYTKLKELHVDAYKSNM